MLWEIGSNLGFSRTQAPAVHAGPWFERGVTRRPTIVERGLIAAIVWSGKATPGWCGPALCVGPTVRDAHEATGAGGSAAAGVLVLKSSLCEPVGDGSCSTQVYAEIVVAKLVFITTSGPIKHSATGFPPTASSQAHDHSRRSCRRSSTRQMIRFASSPSTAPSNGSGAASSSGAAWWASPSRSAPPPRMGSGTSFTISARSPSST